MVDKEARKVRRAKLPQQRAPFFLSHHKKSSFCVYTDSIAQKEDFVDMRIG